MTHPDQTPSTSTTPQSPLSEGEAFFRSIVDSAMDAIITVNHDQKIQLFNGAAERMFGYPASQAIGMQLERLVPQQARDTHAQRVRAFGQTGTSNRTMGHLGTISGVRADGSEFPMEASISHATIGGDRFYTVIIRDISERLKLEAQLLQAQKMEGIGRLAGGVAHDFNNLLMAMFNCLTLATRKIEQGHPALSSIARAHEAAERAASLTRQLLAFARKQVVSPRVLCLRDVVSAMEPLLRRLIGEQVKIRAAYSPETGNVRADPSQIEQVLMNLVVNARDAMPEGGTLTIETGNTTLDDAYCRTKAGAIPGPHVVIAVTDTGAGMSAQVLSRLFEPFFTTKEPGKGTGLGLATCHGIVKQSGGHINVYSEVGRGTAVKIFLPRIVEGADMLPAGARRGAPVGGTETVLLAEDSDIVRDLAAEALISAGYAVLVAENGRRALELAAAFKGKIDLLVTDVVMPELSGVHLAEALAKTRPETPCIFMSGYTGETIIEHGVKKENVFLAKPFMTDELLRTVREVLG